MRRDNFRKELQPGTSWGTRWQTRHIISVTESPTGLPQMITYYVVMKSSGNGYVCHCQHSTFQDWAWANGMQNKDIEFAEPTPIESIMGDMAKLFKT
jgi:hypothetical protein